MIKNSGRCSLSKSFQDSVINAGVRLPHRTRNTLEIYIKCVQCCQGVFKDIPAQWAKNKDLKFSGVQIGMSIVMKSKKI